MGKRKSEAKNTAKRDIRIQRANPKTVCKNQEGKKGKPKTPNPGRKQQTKPIDINDSDFIKITVEHFFKNKINELISKIADPRNKTMCTYSSNHLIWLGLLMFIFRLKSRNQLLMERETDIFHRNLLSLSGSDETDIAHPDTMNYFLELLSVKELELLKVQLVKELIKKRVLDPVRLFGNFRIAVDATGLFNFKQKHCSNCLVTEHNDKTTTYSHKMLEAKLVSENGFAFSIYSESIENIDEKYIKQDCELKAFYRMEKELKKIFLRTPICLLLDGIYACEEVFNICKRNGWEFIVVLKPKRIPTLFKNAVKKRNNYPKNELIIENKREKEIISWVHNIQYHEHKLHVIFSKKTVIKGGREKVANNTWITNIRPKAKNIEALVAKGGRQRWKIENQGFKEQKCDGYELEHLYGKKPNAWKNYYQLLQIAHMISQLIIHGDLCRRLQEYTMPDNSYHPIKSFGEYYNTIRNFVKRLCESFRNKTFSHLTKTLKGKIQIRFSSG
jgi:hypothetical protein